MKVELTFDGKRTLYVSSETHGTKIFMIGDKLEDGMVEYIEKVLFT